MIKRFSKHVCLLLTAVLLFACAFVPMSSVIAENKIWDGTTTGGAITGGGTEADPYLITNGAQLAWVITNGGNGRYYKLTEDVYLNDVDKVNWSTGEGIGDYAPKSWYNSNTAPRFDGTIDGDGHVVYGLYYKDATPQGVRTTGYGLIPCGGNITVKNLGIDKSYLEAYTNYSLGALVGLGQGSLTGSIDSCYSGAEVTVKGFDAGAILGGGDINDNGIKITNVYSLATVEGSHLCGMIGDIWTGEYALENVYAVGCKIVGKGNPKTTNTYSSVKDDCATQLSTDQMQGSVFSGNNMLLGNAFIATDTYPVLRTFVKNAPRWGSLAEPFTKGDGNSAATAYEVSTPGQLAHAVALGDGKYYKLVNDIFINDIEKIDWTNGSVKVDGYTPIEWFSGTDSNSAKYSGFADNMQFRGTLDGNGYAVYGLWYSPEFSKITSGLIPGVSSATVKNLTLSHSYVVCGRFAGGISSTFAGSAEKVVVDNTVTIVDKKNVAADSYSCGGLFGYTNGITLTDCAFYGTLVGANHVYGLVGTSWGSNVHATNCFSIGYQPFTTSLPAKNYGTKAEADANYLSYFNGLYKVSNVYTDTHFKDNTATYKYDSDGKDTNSDGNLEYDKSVTHNVFTFTELTDVQMKSLDSLKNMSALSADNWYPRDDMAPITKRYGAAHGDVNGDTVFLTKEDIETLRRSLIGTDFAALGDANGDLITDICDLVAINSVKCFAAGSADFPVAVSYTEWNGPEGYVVIYPAADSEAEGYANRICNIFTSAGYSVTVSPDTAAVTAKEILVGNTNRPESLADIAENKYGVTLIGEKLVINSKCAPGLSETVRIFAAIPVRYKEIPQFVGYNDFIETIILANGNKYSYVWGDEFSGTALDTDKWVCSTGRSKMSGFKDMPILSDERTVRVQNGHLRLSAISYTDPNDPEVKYAVPASVHSQGTMEYRYGYAEIRARVPFKQGVWPSFWMQSSATLGGRKCYDYFVEVDVFEIFGNEKTVVPNLHKWYSDTHDPSTHDCTYTGNHTSSGTDKSYVYSDYANLSNEYHTYGFEWTPTQMSMYVDGVCYKTYDITKSYDKCSDISGFSDPMFFIFNNHLFSPLSSYKPNLITGNEASLPANYDIDYFRLYQSDSLEGSAIWTK